MTQPQTVWWLPGTRLREAHTHTGRDGTPAGVPDPGSGLPGPGQGLERQGGKGAAHAGEGAGPAPRHASTHAPRMFVGSCASQGWRTRPGCVHTLAQALAKFALTANGQALITGPGAWGLGPTGAIALAVK